VKAVWIGVGVALVLWGLMFGAQIANFWLSMSIAATGLAVFALWSQRSTLRTLFCAEWQHVVIGVVSAGLLYAVFFVGDAVSALLFDFATPQVQGIYGMKAGTSPVLISVLLVALIGPAEEIFWRGLVQQRLMERVGAVAGWLLGALVYAAVHVWAWNFMLFMAALVCGLFWGLMYLRWRSLTPVIISHALWDLAIFVLFPIH